MEEFSFPFQPSFRNQLLHWAAAFPYAVFLDSCHSSADQYGKYDFICGVKFDDKGGLITDLGSLREIWDKPRWKFGIFSYELKNKIEPVLKSRHEPFIHFPELGFFEADVVIRKERGKPSVVISGDRAENIFKEINSVTPGQPGISGFKGFQSDLNREDYLDAVEQLRQHIREGDCYEINLCRHFLADGKLHNPAAVFEELCRISPAPFAGFARMKDVYLLSASPERLLRKSGSELLTQPIKGTASRGKTQDEDDILIHRLRNSEKEQAENVMIVDLSRNDLNRSCEVNSVQVPHLFEVQSFPQVHHLVSSVTGKMRNDINSLDAFLNVFPPGSMTGAPKVRVCQIIDSIEKSARGIYSGSLGYVDPQGDFDFNVIIRSLLYDEAKGRISFHTGGAITWDSVPEQEWEETLLKAGALVGLLHTFSG